MPQQLSQIGSQAEARAGQALGDAAAARQAAQAVEQQLTAKLKELEARAARASEEVGRVEAQASGIGTRTEKLETDIINLTKQLEARTDELSTRTAKEREDQATRLAALQNVAFAGIIPSTHACNAGYFCRVGVLKKHCGNRLQVRLMRALELRARHNGWSCIVSDTTDNLASANNFIRAGYRLYQPQCPWAWPNTLYWRKSII